MLERTRHLDIVCPRTQATVHFASDPAGDNAHGRARQGLAPEGGVEGAAGITGSQTQDAAPE